MSQPISKTYTMVAADANGVCLSQTPAAGASVLQSLTIAGALASGGSVTLDAAQKGSITGGSNESGRTFTFIGTDINGRSLSEEVTGPNATVVYTTGNFLTITGVTVDGDTAGAITIGIDDAMESNWIPLNTFISPFEYSYSVDIGTATFVVESTIDNIQDASITPAVFADVAASGSSDVTGSSTAPVTAIRLKVTAFTTGDIAFKVLQSGR